MRVEEAVGICCVRLFLTVKRNEIIISRDQSASPIGVLGLTYQLTNRVLIIQAASAAVASIRYPLSCPQLGSKYGTAGLLQPTT
jgi:hypothetical protein